LKADIATFDKSNSDFSSDSNSVKDRASNRSTNTKAARFQHTSKALAFVLLSNGRLRHCAQQNACAMAGFGVPITFGFFI
jgi:hypothetical protein